MVVTYHYLILHYHRVAKFSTNINDTSYHKYVGILLDKYLLFRNYMSKYFGNNIKLIRYFYLIFMKKIYYLSYY